MESAKLFKTETMPNNTNPETIWAELLYTLPYGRCGRPDCGCLRFEVDPAHFVPSAPMCTVCDHHQGYHHLGTDADRTYGMRRRQNLVNYTLCIKQIPSIEAPPAQQNPASGALMFITDRQSQADLSAEATPRFRENSAETEPDQVSGPQIEKQDQMTEHSTRASSSKPTTQAPPSVAGMSTTTTKPASPTLLAEGPPTVPAFDLSLGTSREPSRDPRIRIATMQQAASERGQTSVVDAEDAGMSRLGAEQLELLSGSPATSSERTRARTEELAVRPKPRRLQGQATGKGEMVRHTGEGQPPHLSSPHRYDSATFQGPAGEGPPDHEVATQANVEDDEEEGPLFKIWKPEGQAPEEQEPEEQEGASAEELSMPERAMRWYEVSSSASEQLEDHGPAHRPWRQESEKTPDGNGGREATANSGYGRPDVGTHSAGQDKQLAPLSTNLETEGAQWSSVAQPPQIPRTAVAAAPEKDIWERSWRGGAGGQVSRQEHFDKYGVWPKETSAARRERRHHSRQTANVMSAQQQHKTWTTDMPTVHEQQQVQAGAGPRSGPGVPGSGTDKTKKRNEQKKRARARQEAGTGLMWLDGPTSPNFESSSPDEAEYRQRSSKNGPLNIPEVSLIDL